MANLWMMFGASVQASFSGTFTRDYYQHLCQKDHFFLNSSIWKRCFSPKLFTIPGLKRVQEVLKKIKFLET